MSDHKTIEFELNNGTKIPAIALGTWLAEKDLVGNAVLTALNHGYRHIDCAKCYENEEEIGTIAFDPFFKEGKVKRSEVFVTSKLWIEEKRKEQVIPACKESLRKLRLDYLDLYLIHWPVSLRVGATWPLKREDIIEVPIEETWGEMEKLVEMGLVKTIGVSNFTIPQLEKLLSIAKIKPAVNQVEFGVFLQQPKLMEYCKEHNIHVTSYSPLGNNGNADRNQVENIFDNSVLKEIAQKHKKTVAQVVLRFIVQCGHSALPKSVHAERIIQNINIFDFILSDEEMEKIKKLDRYERTTPGSSFYTALGIDKDTFWGVN
ncbi:aldose reductase, putative [Entamoeba invadens IP1]|uniref:Aldose reductase, putative n=1 Tax=Entamoeba invadens IP1 TaxID=370355 RepID=A0A0A1U3Z1_ENTIV|nr:aldose reductase, putative [Entamoeba invadens IP1]ELP86406.1 aldose reductase, putative [Entamoeba invadens IP1]|eukprot:XP_004185752.1 aldose reductase, putative [Entamoeba invadens IP1]